MCGRYTISSPLDILKDEFHIINSINFPASYNAAPSQALPVVIGNEIRLMEWGFLPDWAQDKDIGPQINARSETVHEKPFFKDAFINNRCLIPANGFYEWTKIKGGKQPWYITTHHIMAFAGIYNESGFCILTKEAVGSVAQIHSRMPVIVSKTQYQNWMNGKTAEALSIIEQAIIPDFDIFTVSTRVNTPANNDETLIERDQLF
tara:strand:- start:845 stop:1459 length:615 start_codon:yes stop_codon:yes gene_type:complete